MKKEKLQTTSQNYKGSWDYYSQLYAKQMNNLEWIDKFFKRYSLLGLNQEEIENMNRSITSTENEMN